MSPPSKILKSEKQRVLKKGFTRSGIIKVTISNEISKSWNIYKQSPGIAKEGDGLEHNEETQKTAIFLKRCPEALKILIS